MEIIVTSHALKEYRTKMFSELDSVEITKILKTIVRKGNIVASRPGGAYSMFYNGISIVVAKRGNTVTVITCLGNKKYSAWSRKEDIRPRYRKAAVC